MKPLSLDAIARAMGGTVTNKQVLCAGPGHSARDQSLSITLSSDDPDGFVVHSHAGDSWEECKDFVREKLGIAPAQKNGAATNAILATYDYRDETGTLLFQVVRQHPKKFLQRRPNGAGWAWNLHNTRRVLYRLPEMVESLALSHPVFIVEGEKDVDQLKDVGIPATCNPGGAGKWRDEYSAQFADGCAYIIPDNDVQGMTHALEVMRSIRAAGGRAHIVLLPDLPPKGDVSNWLNAGGTAEELYRLAEAAQSKPDPGLPTNNDETLPPAIKPWWRDPATIPGRRFLYDRHYIRGTVSATIGGGGRAKTTGSIYELVSMAVGRELSTGEPLSCGPLRVGMLNGEEDQDELDRRTAAVCQRYGVTKVNLGGRLFVESVRNNPLRIATMVKNVPTIEPGAIARLRAFVDDCQLDALVVDPLVSFHSVPENDNGPMDVVIKEGFGAIAGGVDVNGTAPPSRPLAVEILHHPGKPKPGQAETTVEDSRGASAVIWAVRVARVLNFMTPEEAAKLGILEDERRLHIRVANGKANMGPLGKAKWMRLVVENLPNGDQVACASRWMPPDPFQGITAADMHKCRTLAQTGAYRADSRAADWIGYVVADVLKINVVHGAENDPKDIARIKQILATWLKNKVLATEKRKDTTRHERTFIIPGSWQPDTEIINPDPDDIILQ